jgi:hypothetical protein
MQMAVTAKPKSAKKSAEDKSVGSRSKIPSIEPRTKIGMPLFLQGMTLSSLEPVMLQRQPLEEEEEALQTKSSTDSVPRLTNAAEQPPLLQSKPLDNGMLQRQLEGEEEEEVLQAKLKIGNPDDEYEREADRVAGKVLHMPGSSSVLARKEIDEEPEQTSVLRFKLNSHLKKPAPTGHQNQFEHSRSPDNWAFLKNLVTSPAGGSPLPTNVKAWIAPVLKKDLSAVRIHNDQRAHVAARALNARAFTHQHHIWLGQNQSANDVQLIAHETAHVVQQHGLSPSGSQNALADVESPKRVQRMPFPGSPAVQQAKPIRVHFDESRPWLFSVEGQPSMREVAREVYGADLPEFLSQQNVFVWSKMSLQARYVAFPELLRSPYKEHFHAAMGKRLDADVRRVESILFELRIDAEDEQALISCVSWWADRKDIRSADHRTYFDAFLYRLKNDHWYRDYGLWKGKSSSFLDLLYEQVEERKGELNTIIAQNSIEYGGYRPVLVTSRSTGEIRFEGRSRISKDLVDRSAGIILDALEGYTSQDDSRIISDTLTGLPAPEQAAVLKKVMSRYDESDWTGLFGRFGEAWEGGMLYWLFEDLEERDQKRIAEALKRSGVLPKETVDALVEGRGLSGKYLPWTSYYLGQAIGWSTRKGAESAQDWANIAEKSQGLKAAGAYFMGGLASLWTPETWGKTTLVLGAPVLASRLLAAFPALKAPLLVAGTGILSYTTTIALQELITGKDVYSGKKLSNADKISRALLVVSGILLIGAGFAQAAQMQAAGHMAEIGEPNLRMRILHADMEAGDYTVWGENFAHGQSQYGIIRLNIRTGTGTAINLTTGKSFPIVGGRLQGPLSGLFPPPAAGGAGLVPASPGPLVPAGPPVSTPPAPIIAAGSTAALPSPAPLAGVTDAEIEAAIGSMTSPKVTGGLTRPRILGHRVPTTQHDRLDIYDIPLKPGETLHAALARVQTIVNRRISDIEPLANAWVRARMHVLATRTLTADNYPELYEATRNRFWLEVRSDAAASAAVQYAGFRLPAEPTTAPMLAGVRPDLPDRMIRLSLDHIREKAIGENWRYALDEDNLEITFQDPNTLREIIQMRHPELRVEKGD